VPKKATHRVTEVVVMTTAMLTFISWQRAAAIVLCDMASTAWYIGGIGEKAIGEAAPWFILGVMLFASCVLALYVEGSAMFVRGGVYKVVREAMGARLAKISVSALMFDYVLTGPISSVSAGQYLAGLINTVAPHWRIGWQVPPATFSMVFAVLVTLYFWRQNIRGVEESSEKAMWIMQCVTGLGLLIFAWSAVTIWFRGFHWPSFSLSFSEHSLGWLHEGAWVGKLGLLIAFGHAFLGMSGAESLAQVYREMEAPKLYNLKKSSVTIFLTCLLLTGGISLLAVGLVPPDVRAAYADNLMAGLAMSLAGPHWLLLILQAGVVIVGAMILSGAVNTSILGGNGVLNRLAEDGIMAEYFRWLHPRYGTTHRMINLIVALQLATILLCRGDVYLLGEAYAFGVIWSFVFMAAAVTMLRYTNKSPREWKVPLNLPIGKTAFPLGLVLIFLVLLSVGLINLFTKTVATIWGSVFTGAFFALLSVSERLNARGHRKAAGEHREKLNLRQEETFGGALAEIDRPNKILVAVRDPKGLGHLQKALESADAKTDIVALHSKVQRGMSFGGDFSLGPEEELLFTRVIEMAEKHGKTVVPMLVVSNDPFYAVAQTAQAVGADEVVMGVSLRVSLEVQLEHLAMAWGALQAKAVQTNPVKIKIVGEGRELSVEF
jgi:amino acid transporter